MSNEPDDMPPYRHIEEATNRLNQAENHTVMGSGAFRENLDLATAHALIAIAKMLGRQRT
jgi:hypothetical protein